jgi:hypothetical protein
MSDTQAAAERFTEQLLQLIELASGRKLTFSLIANLQTGITETVENEITRAVLQLEADAERRGCIAGAEFVLPGVHPGYYRDQLRALVPKIIEERQQHAQQEAPHG